MQEEDDFSSTYRLNGRMLQPWSTPVMMLNLPPEIIQQMLEISDEVVANKESESMGSGLVGQIDKELKIKQDILEQAGILGFFLAVTRQFVIFCKSQKEPYREADILQEEWLTEIQQMWVVSQQPGEYNPIHIHANCHISTVMYLKVPKILPCRKEHREGEDGSILFVNNASRDINFSAPTLSIPPKVGDMYIFGAHQQHAVYPFRCAEGQKDTERRSVSFNAVYKSKTDHDKEKEKNQGT